MLLYILLELINMFLILCGKSIEIFGISNFERLLPTIISLIFVIKHNFSKDNKSVLLLFIIFLADVSFIIFNECALGIAIFMLFQFLVATLCFNKSKSKIYLIIMLVNILLAFLIGKKLIIIEAIVYGVFSIYNIIVSKKENTKKIKYALLFLLLCDTCIAINYYFSLEFIIKIEYVFYILFQILFILYCTNYKNNTWYKILSPIIKVIMKLYYNPIIVNKEYIPVDGAVVIAGNHKHALDPILVDCCTNRVVHTLAKKDLHDGKFGFFFRAIETIPVDLKAKHNKEALISAIKVLENGEVINLSPEAKRNYTKEILLSFKPGAVVMAKRTNTIIVPYSITGDYKFRSKNLKIEFDKPIDVSNLEVDEANELLYKKVKKLLIKNKGEK